MIEGDALKQINALPAVKDLPIGVSRLTVGQSKAQDELISNIIIAVLAGFFLLFAVLVLLYRRFLPPFVNLGSLFLAPLGACIALWIAGMAVSMPVYIGLLMLLGIVAKNSILLVDFALEEMGKGVRRARRDPRRRPQARAADRDDHRRDGRGHGPDRAVGDRRRIVPRADERDGDGRADPVDRADAADRAVELQPGAGRRAGDRDASSGGGC